MIGRIRAQATSGGRTTRTPSLPLSMEEHDIGISSAEDDSLMKLPGSDHPITIARNWKRVRVTFAGKTIADTTRALTLKEADYPVVNYIPRDDVDMSALARTSHRSHCPYKGNASYFAISVDGRSAENAAWSYEQPYPPIAEIKEHVAFYPRRVDTIEES